MREKKFFFSFYLFNKFRVNVKEWQSARGVERGRENHDFIPVVTFRQQWTYGMSSLCTTTMHPHTLKTQIQ